MNMGTEKGEGGKYEGNTIMSVYVLVFKKTIDPEKWEF